MAKKIKKVEAPIDNRETFVSLQKKFAETEAAVTEKLATLYALQKADSAIDSILQLRGELPSEVVVLEQEVEELKAKIEKLALIIEEYTKSITQHKNDIVEADENISKYQKQIENIANSREYDSINKEIENQGLLRQIAEKNIYDTQNIIEDKTAYLEDLKAKLEIREADLVAKKEELDNIVESTSKEENKLNRQRKSCANKIDERTMSAYERIRKSVKNHLAVVPIYNGDACGGCFNTITSQRIIEVASNKKVVICEHCGRIIVNSQED